MLNSSESVGVPQEDDLSEPAAIFSEVVGFIAGPGGVLGQNAFRIVSESGDEMLVELREFAEGGGHHVHVATEGATAVEILPFGTMEQALVVFERLLSLRDPYEGQCEIELDATKPGPNTTVDYMYRDGANYKCCRDVVFSGRADRAHLALLCMCLDDEGGFIPGQVGLADLQDSFQGCESAWDPDLDHPFHELCGMATTDAPATGGDLREFVKRMLHARYVDGWDEEYLPPNFPEMAARHRARFTQQA